jgi:hypothetical protein
MVRLATEIADALAHAHGRGVIHRDVKPSNVIVTLDGHAKLIDFGIAVTSEDDSDRLTRTGMFIGSHGYAAPEQLRGEHDEVGPWTDTYALGATLFEMLTQRTPFEAATYADRLGRAGEPPPCGPRHHNRKVPRALDALVMRALHPDPKVRFHDGEELAEALRECPTLPSILPGIPTKALSRLVPRTALQSLAAGATACALVLGYLYWEERVENERMAARSGMAEMMAGNALLDGAVRGIKGDLETCLSFERRIDGLAVRPARLVADLLVERGVLADVRVTMATTNIGVRARRCMLDEVRRLELPGIGFVKPVMLQIDLRVAPPPGG